MSTLSKKVVSGVLTATTFVWASGALALIPVASAQTTSELQAQIAALLAQIQQLQAQLGSPQPGDAMAMFNFTRDLTLGSTGDDVKALQQFLNSHGAQIASTGPGSPGNESTYFGAKTKAALARYQVANGISPALGYFGPRTRAQVNGLAGPGPVPPPPSGDMCANIEGVQTFVPTGLVRDVAGNCVAGTPSASGLTVSVGSDNPGGSAVPFGANNVRFMSVVLTGTGTVNTITFSRIGAGQTSDFVSSGAYLLDENGSRLTTGRTVNSTTHKATFTGLNLDVNGSKKLWLVAAMRTNSSGAGNRNAFEITSVSDISASVAVSGNFPVRGNEFVLTSAGVGGVTISSSTDPTNPKVGEQQAKVGSFKIENTSSTDDLEVQSVSLRYAGAVSRGNLTNFVLKYAGSNVGTATAITSKDLLTIKFNPPFLLERGQNRIFELFADIAPGVRSGSNETIIWYIEDANDLVAVSRLYGYGAITTNSYGGSSTAGQHMTIDGGQITITFKGPIAQDIPTNKQDAVLMELTIAAQSNVEIRNLRFVASTTGNGSATNEKFSDFKVVDAATGVVVAGPHGSDITTGGSIVLSDTWTVASGQSRNLKVTADVGSASGLANDTIRVDLAAFTGTDIKNVDSNTDISTSDIVPGSITGNTMTVKAPDLAITLSGTPASRTLTKGSANVDLVAFNFRAVADDIQIKSIKISASSTANAASAQDVIDALGSLKLTIGIGGSQLGQTKSLTGSSQPVTADFTNLNYTIKNSETKTIVVNASQISNNASSTDYAVRLNDLSADIVAVDTQGNTLTLSGSLNGGAGTVVLTLAQPSLTVTRVGAGSTDTDSLHVIAGTTAPLTQLEFRATNGDVSVTKIRFGVASANTNATATGLGDDAATVSMRQCTDATCSVKTPISGLTDLTVDATGNGAGTVLAQSLSAFFTIPRGQSRYFTLEAGLGNVVINSAEGADSGQDLYASLRLSDFEAASGNTQLTTFATSTGGTSLGVTGLQKELLRSQPKITVAKPSGSLTAGLSELLRMTVEADTNAIALKAFGVNIATTLATFSTAFSSTNVNVALVTDPGTNLVGSVSGATINSGASGDLYIIFTNPQIIFPGSPRTFIVKATPDNVGTSANGAKVVASLDRNESSISNSGTTGDFLTSTGSYGASTKVWVWSDLSDDQTGVETNTDWGNAYLLRPFPTESFSAVP